MITKAKLGYLLAVGVPVVSAVFRAVGRPEAAEAVEGMAPHLQAVLDGVIVIVAAVGAGLLHFAPSPKEIKKR